MQEFLSQSLNRKNIIRGFLFFVLCTLIGLYVSFLWGGTKNFGSALSSIRGKFLVIAMLCMLSDWACGAARFYIFVRKMAPQVTFFDSIRATLATLCVGGITPFQTGGVGYIYIFNRSGVPLSGCMTLGIISFIGTLMFLICSAGYAVWKSPSFLPKGFAIFGQYSLVMFALVLLFLFVMVIKPGVLLFPLTKIRLMNHRGFRFPTKVLNRLALSLEKLIGEHKAFTHMFITHHKGVFALSLLLSGGIYMSRFVGGYVVVQVLGGNTPFWDVIAAQAILHFTTLFAPSPGASGIAEFFTVVLMEDLIKPDVVALYALMTRFFTTYFAVAIGGTVLVPQLAKDLKQGKEK
ncbi:MAG: lysylphosphatidylglycerol synthase transmembrane domain-containing protein [Candidatus Poribacteria bacterium]|nr:lysylphosphatidylglycerol synthase transmembrane domain-containing protein [Candidatus Poribacteria bacterium]